MQAKQVSIGFDPNIRFPLWLSEELIKDRINRYLPSSHIVKISEEELTFLTGIADEKEAISNMLIGDVQLVLVTKGARGCTYYTRKMSETAEGYPVKAEDTTGAGDAFYGALLYKIAQSVDDESLLIKFVNDAAKMDKVLSFANACGALTTTKRGAIAALSNKDEIEYLMKEAHVA